MAVTDIGRVTPIWRGIYSAETAYELNDIVLDAECSVWWHVAEEVTVGVSPGPGEIWAAVIDMSVFSTAIQAAIAEAQEAVREAEEAAGTLEGFAERAEAAANDATLSAGAASDFATAASDEKRGAEAARAGAETAQSAAETAQTAAETAQTAAETAQSAAETARSGAQTAKSGAEAARDTALTYKQSAAAAKDDAELARDKAEEYAEALEIQIDPTFRTPGTAAESVAVSKKTASAVVSSASGNPVVIPDAAGERVFRSAAVDIDLVQEGSGDPAPDNVRPISGWTGAEIVRCGGNLAELHNDTNPNAGNFTYSRLDGGNITCTKGNSGGYYAKFMFPAVKGTTYRFAVDSFTVNGANYQLSVHIYKDELWGEDIERFNIQSPSNPLTWYDWTATESGLLVVGLYTGSATEPGTVVTLDGFRIGLAAEADKGYAAYEGDTCSVAFPSEAGTVYGGTLDLTAGTLTVTHGFRQCSGTDVNQYGTTSGGVPNVKLSNTSDVAASGDIYCDRYMGSRGGSTESGIFRISPNGSTYIYDSRFTDEATAKQILTDERPVLVYPLATPIVYQLTPVQIEALAGLNVVSADCGAVSVEYVRDTGAAIDAGDADTRAMIGEASGTTASRSLAVGEYVTVGDKLYRVTSAIGSGETLVPGGNVTETTVGAELSRLASLINA